MRGADDLTEEIVNDFLAGNKTRQHRLANVYMGTDFDPERTKRADGVVVEMGSGVHFTCNRDTRNATTGGYARIRRICLPLI